MLEPLELFERDYVKELIVKLYDDLKLGGNGSVLGWKMPAKALGVCYLKLMRRSGAAIEVHLGAVVMHSMSFGFLICAASGFC